MLLWLSLATETVPGQAYPVLQSAYCLFISNYNVFTFLDHDLVTNTPTSGIVCNSMLLGEFVDKRVFLQVGFGLVLDVVV
jgi:hypothetical protein